MPAHIFVGYYAAIIKSTRLEFNKQLKAAAFTAWRFEVTIAGALGGGKNKVSYPDYLDAHGLLTEEERKQNELHKRLVDLHNKQKAREGAKKAAEIMDWDIQRTASLKEGEKKGQGG